MFLNHLSKFVFSVLWQYTLSLMPLQSKFEKLVFDIVHIESLTSIFYWLRYSWWCTSCSSYLNNLTLCISKANQTKSNHTKISFLQIISVKFGSNNLKSIRSTSYLHLRTFFVIAWTRSISQMVNLSPKTPNLMRFQKRRRNPRVSQGMGSDSIRSSRFIL